MFTLKEYNDLNTFVEETSWFDVDPYDDYEIMMSTRENGSVYDEEPGEKDIDEADRLCTAIRTRFGYLASWDTAHEWVNIYVGKQ